MHFLFILPFVVIMADQRAAAANGELQSDADDQITKLCKNYFQGSAICNNKEVMGTLGFFIFSTIISLIFGIFRRCIFRCKTCCIYGTRSSRRKRMEEERQENEMFEKQMSSLQMRKNLLTRQQKSLQALLQGSQAQGKGKKKKKSSKKGPQNSMNNAIQLSYQSPPQ